MFILCVYYLGNLKQRLGDINNTRKLGDVVNTLLDGVGVVGTSTVQNVSVLLNLAISPLLVSRATVLGDGSENADNTEKDDGFLVDNVELVADGSDGETGSGGESGGLGDQAVTGEGIEDRLSLLLGVLAGKVRVATDRGEGAGNGSEVASGQSRPQAGGTWGSQ